jgi:SAM-dependent methyltransferase
MNARTDSVADTLQAAFDPRFERALRRCVDLPGRLNMTLHPNDQMLIHSLREHRDIGATLSQYFNLSLQQYDAVAQILHALFPERPRDVDLLDFACGYGRLLRMLVAVMPASRVWASELQADANTFVESAFGVQVVSSHADPARFAPAQRFDFIWVASLFTHLPEHLFHGWLAKLYALLKPDGVLCFSVRDVAQLRGTAAAPDGFLYREQSENDGLSADIYGTAYADRAFVERAMRTVAGEGCSAWHLPRALANEQELYLLARAGRSFDRLRGFRRGAWGWVDRRVLSREGELYLEGWAGSQDEGAAQEVLIRVDDETYRALPLIARPDVQAAFGDERLAHCGWRIRERIAPRASAFVEVTSHPGAGPPALLYAGEIAAAL